MQPAPSSPQTTRPTCSYSQSSRPAESVWPAASQSAPPAAAQTQAPPPQPAGSAPVHIASLFEIASSLRFAPSDHSLIILAIGTHPVRRCHALTSRRSTFASRQSSPLAGAQILRGTAGSHRALIRQDPVRQDQSIATQNEVTVSASYPRPPRKRKFIAQPATDIGSLIMRRPNGSTPRGVVAGRGGWRPPAPPRFRGPGCG